MVGFPPRQRLFRRYSENVTLPVQPTVKITSLAGSGFHRSPNLPTRLLAACPCGRSGEWLACLSGASGRRGRSPLRPSLRGHLATVSRSATPKCLKADPISSARESIYGRHAETICEVVPTPTPTVSLSRRLDVAAHRFGLALDVLDPVFDQVADRNHSDQPTFLHDWQVADPACRHQRQRRQH